MVEVVVVMSALITIENIHIMIGKVHALTRDGYDNIGVTRFLGDAGTLLKRARAQNLAGSGDGDGPEGKSQCVCVCLFSLSQRLLRALVLSTRSYRVAP